MASYATETKIEDGKLYAHTVFDDDMSLANNKRIRNSNLFDKPKLAIHENEDTRYIISCPDVFQWNLWKNKYKEEYKQLTSSEESERMKGARALALMHPEWLLFSRA